MRGSRIFIGLVVIALVAIGLLYLDQAGYLQNPKVTPMGVMRSDETAPGTAGAPTTVPPKPANSPDPMATNGAVASPTDMNAPAPETSAAAPGNANGTNPYGETNTAYTAPATSQHGELHEAMRTAQEAAVNVPTKPGAAVQYVDAQGNACRPVQIDSIASHEKRAIARNHSRPRTGRRSAPDNWKWQPAGGPHYSTPCGNIAQTVSGQRVVNLEAGMVINIALNQEVSTSGSAAGQGFTGYLVGPITYCGQVIVPAGAEVDGAVVSKHRHTPWQQDDAILQLRLTALDANGYRIPLAAYSYNRRMPNEPNYKTTNYMNDPNYIETTHTTNHDITLPAQSVVSFWLQSSTAVYF